MAHNNLKELLEKEGIKQIDFAKEINLSPGTINRVCNQTYAPAPTTKYKMLKGLLSLTDNQYTLQNIFPTNKKQ